MIHGRTRYVGFGVTIAFIALIVWKVDLSQMASALATANYLWAAPVFLTTCLSYLVRTIRWGRILRPIQVLSVGTLLPVLLIGFMANNLLPARMGEVIRAYTLGRKTGLSKSMGLATILLERVCDGLALVAALGLVALLFPLPAWGRDVGYLSGSLFVGILLASAFVLAREQWALRLLERAIQPLPRRIAEPLARLARSSIVGFEVLRRGHDVLVVVGWSIVIWSIETTTYLLALRSVHPSLETGTPLLAALLLMATVNLGSLIPSAPGYVGTFQAFGVLALSAFGIPQGVALAVVVVAYAGQWLTVTGLGLICVARESIGLGLLTRLEAVDGSASS